VRGGNQFHQALFARSRHSLQVALKQRGQRLLFRHSGCSGAGAFSRSIRNMAVAGVDDLHGLR
jgi:hypothetical protein